MTLIVVPSPPTSEVLRDFLGDVAQAWDVDPGDEVLITPDGCRDEPSEQRPDGHVSPLLPPHLRRDGAIA